MLDKIDTILEACHQGNSFVYFIKLHSLVMYISADK
jgi:hypothetical protein